MLPPYGSPIEKLDTPCLVRVLQQLSSQQQLVACGAVCSKWRMATREAISSIHISSIHISRCTQEQCDQLQQWLVHPPAALYSLHLSLALHPICRPGLRLPLSVLQHLRELGLHGVRLEAIAADGSVLTVADLLPRLQQCTISTIRAWWNTELKTAAAAFHAMPVLQDLDIDGDEAGLPGSLVVLPTTLTRLYLSSEGVINTANAASISQLTGLHVLEAETGGFDTSVLANCAGLERVEIALSNYQFSSLGEGWFTTPLLVFASMPSLQHLQLQSEYEDPMATAAEVAALSASSNLTYLSLGGSEYCALSPAAYDSWFPVGHLCPYLAYVDVGEWVLGNTAAVQRMVSACPRLKDLELHSASHPGNQLESTCVAASLQALTNFTALTCLRVDGAQLPVGVCISPAVISAWSQMTSLQQLELQFQAEWWPSHMQDVLRLTQLRSLRVLYLEDYTEDKDVATLLGVKSQVGSPPDVWQQLPSALWSAAIEHQQSRIRDLQRQQQEKQSDAAALLEQQKAAQTHAAALLQQHAAAEANAAALRQQQAEAQAQLIALQREQATAQAQVVGLLQEQRRVEVVTLRQEQQEEVAALRQQAEAGQAQIAQLQGQVATLQATVAALLERHG